MILNESLKYTLFFIFVVMLMPSCKSKSAVALSFPDMAMDIKTQLRLAKVDKLGNIYIVDTKNRLIKYDNKFNELYRYANNRYGLISTVDVTNPLRIVLFYDDFNQVSILDNTLSVIRSLDLSQQFLDVSACGVSNDGHLWIYDPVQFKLLKINEEGRSLTASDNVNNFGIAGGYISEILESDNHVVLCDFTKGFWFFDNFGRYVYHFPVQGLNAFQFDGKFVIYYTSTGLKTFSILLKERQIIAVDSFSNTQEMKYILYNDGYYYGVFTNGIIRKGVQE